MNGMIETAADAIETAVRQRPRRRDAAVQRGGGRRPDQAAQAPLDRAPFSMLYSQRTYGGSVSSRI